MSLVSLQGHIRVGARLSSGKPGPLVWVGNVPTATISLATETSEKKESFSGQRLPYGLIDTGKSGTLNMTLDEWSLKNLALGLYGKELAVVTGSVATEEFPDDLVVGDQVRLAHPYASALVITDSTGSPVTVNTAHYRLTGHNDSIVEILNLSTYLQPFKAAYTYAAYRRLEAFATPPPERYVIFDGINTATGEGVLADLYRVKLAPFSELGLIHTEFGEMQLTGSLLFDELNVDEDGDGGFFRIRQKAA